MPREPRWARDGPSRRAPGTSPERGNPGAAGAGCRGKTFWFLLGRLPKGTRPAGRNQCLSQLRHRALGSEAKSPKASRPRPLPQQRNSQGNDRLVPLADRPFNRLPKETHPAGRNQALNQLGSHPARKTNPRNASRWRQNALNATLSRDCTHSAQPAPRQTPPRPSPASPADPPESRCGHCSPTQSRNDSRQPTPWRS